MNRIVLSTAIASIGLCGCARDRDFAVVEPTLSRHYQGGPTALVAANPPATGGNVVGIQPVAGQKGVVQPVYQTPPLAAGAPPNAVGNVALPPASSTGTQVEGQPYYAPPGQNIAAVQPTPPPSLPLSPGAVAATGGIPAGVYPAAPSGMWMPTKGNQSIAIHQFSTPTTGSSFMPSSPSSGTAASSQRTGDGVIRTGAFLSAIPTNSPPPQSTHIFGMSETGDHMQASRIPEKRAVAVPPAELDARPPTPLPKREFSDPESPKTKRTEPTPLPPPLRSKDDDEALDRKLDLRKKGEVLPASPADPPRTRREEPAPKKESPPASINLGADPARKKMEDPGPPPSAPKKLPQKKDLDDGPLGNLPTDDLAPPPLPKKASGS